MSLWHTTTNLIGNKLKLKIILGLERRVVLRKHKNYFHKCLRFAQAYYHFIEVFFQPRDRRRWSDIREVDLQRGETVCRYFDRNFLESARLISLLSLLSGKCFGSILKERGGKKFNPSTKKQKYIRPTVKLFVRIA